MGFILLDNGITYLCKINMLFYTSILLKFIYMMCVFLLQPVYPLPMRVGIYFELALTKVHVRYCNH